MKFNHPLEGYHKTRLAPTPSGYLHLGNAFSFALTASFAALNGAALFLRIDDMDAARAKPEYVRDIFETLEFLDIHWQEGPGEAIDVTRMYSQTFRMPLYTAALEQLRLTGDVFACTCSRSGISAGKEYPGTCREKNIPLDMPGACWRLKTDATEILTINNYSAGACTTNLPASMSDFIIRKKDGYPSYQLTSVVDDMFFDVDLIIRGEDLLPSTLAQVILAKRLGYEDFGEASFFFHPLIGDSRSTKLSKSAGDAAIASLIKTGIAPEELYFLIGKAIGMEQELDSWEPLAEFILNRVP